MSEPFHVNPFTMKIIFVIFLISSAFTLHKFYVSMCEINYASEERQLHITLKIFTDDLESALTSFAGKIIKNNKENKDLFNEILSSYLKQNLSIRVDSVMRDIRFIGEEPDYDVTWCYLEVDSVSHFHTLTFTCGLLTEIFADQVTIVNVTQGTQKKGLLLFKGKETGTLSFSP
jgi:hypothetical protein